VRALKYEDDNIIYTTSSAPQWKKEALQNAVNRFVSNLRKIDLQTAAEKTKILTFTTQKVDLQNYNRNQWARKYKTIVRSVLEYGI
jgi:hypothetical protein